MNVENILGLNPIKQLDFNSKLKDKDDEKKVSFSEALIKELDKVRILEADSAKLTNDFVEGKIDNIHEVMIAAGKSSIAISLAVQIKNKLTEAYTEIMRMQI